MYRVLVTITDAQIEQEVRRVQNVIATHEAYLTRLQDELRHRRLTVDIDEKIREALS